MLAVAVLGPIGNTAGADGDQTLVDVLATDACTVDSPGASLITEIGGLYPQVVVSLAGEAVVLVGPVAGLAVAVAQVAHAIEIVAPVLVAGRAYGGGGPGVVGRRAETARGHVEVESRAGAALAYAPPVVAGALGAVAW